MTKPLKVDGDKFNRVLRNLIRGEHVKRDDIAPDAKKPGKLIAPPETEPQQDR